MVFTSSVTAFAANNGDSDDTIVYASLGDSMTNGYCLFGYEGVSGAIDYGVDSYANQFAAWLAGYEDEIADDQVIFEGSKATVDHRQLALSGMRAQDVQWALTMDYTNNELMQDVYAMDYSGEWNESTWYDTWKFYGDRFTWSELCDYDYRYADAAARILATYTGENEGYFESSYADESAITNAENGLASNPKYPEGKQQSQDIGGYKYLQIATEYYQESVKDADIISLGVGNTNFGTFMLSNITDVIMGGDMSFSEDYDCENVMAQATAFSKSQVEKMLESEDYAKIKGALITLAQDDANKQKEIAYIVEYCMRAFIVGYVGMLDAILELNPDAEIIMVALMNAYEQKDGTVAAGTMGELVQTIYKPVNSFLQTLPEELLASKSEEIQEKYEDAKFYWTEADYVSCMVDVFGDDYYMDSTGEYVSYPGPLKGTEEYTANYDSIVRARFVEEIVYGDMIFAAMGLAKDESEVPIQTFLKGAIDYDMMTPVEKAEYAAQYPDAAKEYALYLGFEKALIESGTENITMSSLASLANIQEVFTEYYPQVEAAIGAARVNHYEPAATFVANQSGGALTKDEIVSIMQTVDSCETDEAKVMVPYAIVAQKVNAMAGEGFEDLLSPEDIKTLADTADSAAYEAAVYELIVKIAKEKYEYDITVEQVKTLATEENGVYLVADQLTGGEYGADTIQELYESGMLATIKPEAAEGIDLLFVVRDAVKKLLANEETIKSGVSGIQTAIDSTAQLAYLLAVPDTMSAKLCANSDIEGALCMNARCLLGTGAGGHPSTYGHDALYDSVSTVFNSEHVCKDEPTWAWEEDYSSAALALKCKVCKQESADADAEVTSTTTATCTEAGQTTYVATATINGAVYTDEKVVESNELGHTYKDAEPTWTWAEDYSSATLTLKCDRCDSTKSDFEVEVTSTTTATCTEAGQTIYVATATYDGEKYTDNKVIDNSSVDALGHIYDAEPTWTWERTAEGTVTGKAAIATFTCTRNCGDTVDVEATSIISETTDKTCEKDGQIVYTATVTFEQSSLESKEFTNVVKVTIPAGHEYVDGYCTECEQYDPETRPNPSGECGEKKAAELTSGAKLILSLGGTAVGTYTFTETSEGWTIQTEDGKYVALVDEVLGYSDTAFAWKYADGRFSADVTKETESSSSNSWFDKIFGGIFGWGSSTTTTTYYLVAGETGITVSTATAGSDATFATITYTTSHKYDDGVVTAPTCTENGYTTFTCTVCGNAVKMHETKATGHNYAANVVAPTCTEDGYTEHTCGNCGDSYKDTVVKATGHNYGEDGVCKNCGAKEEILVEVDKEVSLTEGTFELRLNGTSVGTFTFAQSGSNWTIQTADGKYVACEDGKLVYSDSAFEWTYSNGKFSCKEESSSSSDDWFSNIFGGIFGWGSSSSTTYYLVADGNSLAVSTSSSNASATFFTKVTESVKPDETPDTPSEPEEPETPDTPEEDEDDSSSSSSWFDKIFGGIFGGIFG